MILLSLAIIVVGICGLRKKYHNILFTVDNVCLMVYLALFCLFFPINYISALLCSGMNDFILSISLIEICAYYFAILIVFLTLNFSFAVLTKKKDIFCINTEKDISKGSTSILKTASFIVFFIGCICDFLYMRAYGNYLNYFSYSNAIRSGVLTVYNPFSFLIPFRGCIIISSYLFLLLLINKETKRLTYFIFFILSSAYSILILYSNKGRVSFAVYFLILFLCVLFSKKNVKYIKLKQMIFLFAGIILFSFVLVFLGAMLGRNGTENVFLEIVDELSFVFNNFFRIIRCDDYEYYRFFIDCFNWPIYLLPSSLWSKGLGLRTASDITTFIASGAFKGELGINGIVYGETPADLITIAYMQLGFLGLPIFILIWAFVGKLLIKIFVKKNTGPTLLFVKIYVAIEFFVNGILYADPKHIVNSIFPFIVFLLVFFVVNLFSKKVRFENTSRPLNL